MVEESEPGISAVESEIKRCEVKCQRRTHDPTHLVEDACGPMLARAQLWQHGQLIGIATGEEPCSGKPQREEGARKAPSHMQLAPNHGRAAIHNLTDFGYALGLK